MDVDVDANGIKTGYWQSFRDIQSDCITNAVLDFIRISIRCVCSKYRLVSSIQISNGNLPYSKFKMKTALLLARNVIR